LLVRDTFKRLPAHEAQKEEEEAREEQLLAAAAAAALEQKAQKRASSCSASRAPSWCPARTRRKGFGGSQSMPALVTDVR